MRILVIGGTQFMGREIVQRLARRGHELSIFHRHDHHDLGPEMGICRQTAADDHPNPYVQHKASSERAL